MKTIVNSPDRATNASVPGSARRAEPPPVGNRPSRSEAQLRQLLRVPLPVLQDFDVEVQEDRGAQESLDLAAGAGTDLAEPFAAVADDDGLLAGALDVEGGVDVEEGAVGRAVLAEEHLLDGD